MRKTFLITAFLIQCFSAFAASSGHELATPGPAGQGPSVSVTPEIEVVVVPGSADQAWFFQNWSSTVLALLRQAKATADAHDVSSFLEGQYETLESECATILRRLLIGDTAPSSGEFYEWRGCLQTTEILVRGVLQHQAFYLEQAEASGLTSEAP